MTKQRTEADQAERDESEAVEAWDDGFAETAAQNEAAESDEWDDDQDECSTGLDWQHGPQDEMGCERFWWDPWTWNVAKAKHLLESIPHPVVRYDISEAIAFLPALYLEGNDCLDADATFPIIVGWKDGERFVIDGWHRVGKADHLGISHLPAVMLTEEENRAILEPFADFDDDLYDDDDQDDWDTLDAMSEPFHSSAMNYPRTEQAVPQEKPDMTKQDLEERHETEQEQLRKKRCIEYDEGYEHGCEVTLAEIALVKERQYLTGFETGYEQGQGDATEEMLPKIEDAYFRGVADGKARGPFSAIELAEMHDVWFAEGFSKGTEVGHIEGFASGNAKGLAHSWDAMVARMKTPDVPQCIRCHTPLVSTHKEGPLVGQNCPTCYPKR